MFTGIIECVGKIIDIQKEGSNTHFHISSEISEEVSVDQSVSHNGVCLTIIKINDGSHWVTAVDETLKKTNVGNWTLGEKINIERSMKANGRFDGHIVQGHVDAVAQIISMENQDGSWLFNFDVENTELIVEKGSICINGASLTCFDVGKKSFSVAIIPYTFENTNFGGLVAKNSVNIEYDIIGKYVRKMLKNNPH